jgi:LDH2 family malate/lactate/ureidoglycolate dehydrogenase
MSGRPLGPQVRLTVCEAEAWATEIFLRYEVSSGDAAVIATHLVDAELHGYRLMGLSRIPRLTEYLRATTRSPISVGRCTPVSAVIDGGHHLGYVVARRMVDLGVQRATQHGVGLVAAHNTSYTGRNGYYMAQIAEHGLIGVMMNNFVPMVAPWGSSEAVFGTNPISIGLPTAADPVVLDMGTSSVMDGELRLRVIENRPLPEGAAFDALGRPTTTPAEALEGAITAFGGHKGSGLALMVQAFAIMANGAALPERPEQSGILMVMIDPGLMLARDEFASRVETLLARVRDARPLDAKTSVMAPGDRSTSEFKRRRELDLIEVSEDVAQTLRAL